MKVFFYSSIFLALLFFNSCKQTQANGLTDDGKYKVVASTGMIGDLAVKIGGDKVKVDVLVGHGLDPHLYTPSRNDSIKMQSAALVLYNGLKLEGKMESTLEKAAKKANVVAVCSWSEGSDYELLGNAEHPDPHVWMDVQAWSKSAKTVLTSLIELSPENRETFESNFAAFEKELTELDQYARESIASIPENARILVTAHDAFGYLGRAYGIEVRGIQGISTESEAGLKDIENLVELIVSRKIPAIFTEASVSDRNVKALVEGAAARNQKVVVGGELLSDSMGASGTYEGTYLGMIDHNVTTLTIALGGKASPKGWKGKLSTH